MPDLRFLSEAAFFIGCGVGGLPLAVLGYVLGMQHPRYKITYGQNWYQEARWKSLNRVRSVEDGRTSEGKDTWLSSSAKRAAQGGHPSSRAQMRNLITLPAPLGTSAGGPEELRRARLSTRRIGSRGNDDRGTAVRLNRRQQITPLTLNPNHDRRLVWLILNETRRNTNDLPLEDVPLTHDTLARYGFGSKVRRRVRDEIVEKRLGWKDDAGTVYLNRHKAREFVARARRAGVIGGR